jgi:hypothetical protein
MAMADETPPSPVADDDEPAAEWRDATSDLTTLAGGLPFEAAMHPAGSGQSRWAQQELGDLLAPGWLDDAPSSEETEAARVAPATTVSAPEPPVSGAIWEVERMPSEAEGGVVGLLLGGPREDPPVPEADRVAAAWDGAGAEAPASGLARLAEMLDHLPADPVRLTPDDVEVAATAPAPPAVWFWGDDDIYPGKVPGAMEARPTARRGRRSA